MNIKYSFTLIELLVVIAIVGILAGIIAISTSKAIDSANDAKRQTDIENLSKAILMYGTSNPNYPLQSAGCQIGNDSSCSILDAVLKNGYFSTIPTDPNGTYYTYVSDGTNFTVSAILSTNKLYSQSSSRSNYYSMLARTSTYNNSFYIGMAGPAVNNINDSANGALWGNVANFTGGWTGYVTCNQSTGFSAGSYDIYMRIRTDGAGSNPASLPFYLYNSNTTSYYINTTIYGLTSSYQVKYIGTYNLLPSEINHTIRVALSLSGITTNYYIDYIEFRIPGG
ncbi:MAG: type II secretion system protein GspG [Candidatus Pacebacteria bacterium]|nr:type II secretion system protein GspG [Candidatus Paceibacterota bacterium]